MNSVLYTYNVNFGDVEEPHKADAGEELAESVDFLRCNSPYNVRRQSMLENTRHDAFEPNDGKHFCSLRRAKRLQKREEAKGMR